mgnify:CR=1 FL=1
MKRFLKGVVEWKLSACAMFTAATFFYLFFSFLYGVDQVYTRTLWGLFWASAAGSLCQAVCFSDWIIKKLRYTWRSLLFVLFFLPALSLVAWRTGWFPADQAGAWVLFAGIFFLIFLVMTLGFDVYFQFTGRKYDGLIGQYRRKKEEDERD